MENQYEGQIANQGNAENSLCDACEASCHIVCCVRPLSAAGRTEEFGGGSSWHPDASHPHTPMDKTRHHELGAVEGREGSSCACA
jgi:hypothetical protein